MYNKRNTVRANFQNPTSTPVTLYTVDGLTLTKEETSIVLHNLSLEGMNFTSTLDIEEGQSIMIQISLFTTTNNIFGKIVWRKQGNNGIRYGIQILSSDHTFFQYMQSYEEFMSKQHKRALA